MQLLPYLFGVQNPRVNMTHVIMQSICPPHLGDSEGVAPSSVQEQTRIMY